MCIIFTIFKTLNSVFDTKTTAQNLLCNFIMKYFLLIITILIANCGSFPQLENYQENKNIDYSSKTNETTLFRFIDVGQGDATLITTNNGNQILIDAGQPDISSISILPLINRDKLDLIIASHYDLDHIGGILPIIKGVDRIMGTEDDIIPKLGILDRGISTCELTATLSDYLIGLQDIRFSLEPGESINIDNLQIKILAQNGCFLDGLCIDIECGYENAQSMSLLIKYNDISILTSGDLPGPNFENQYEPYDLEPYLTNFTSSIDMLHVSHHGSHNSSSSLFIDDLKPKTAVISVGDNDYGHPSDITLTNLRNINAQIHLTEGDWIEDKTELHIENGDICFESNGEFLRKTKCQ